MVLLHSLPIGETLTHYFIHHDATSNRHVERVDIAKLRNLDKGIALAHYLRRDALAFATIQIPISAFWSERRIYNWKKVEVEKAKDFRQDKRELISLQIQDAWDNLESTYRQTQIAKKSVERSEENLRINREHYLNGMKNMTELLDAQRQWQQALTSRNAANSEYLQAKTRYLILTGRRDEVNN